MDRPWRGFKMHSFLVDGKRGRNRDAGTRFYPRDAMADSAQLPSGANQMQHRNKFGYAQSTQPASNAPGYYAGPYVKSDVTAFGKTAVFRTPWKSAEFWLEVVTCLVSLYLMGVTIGFACTYFARATIVSPALYFWLTVIGVGVLFIFWCWSTIQLNKHSKAVYASNAGGTTLHIFENLYVHRTELFCWGAAFLTCVIMMGGYNDTLTGQNCQSFATAPGGSCPTTLITAPGAGWTCAGRVLIRPPKWDCLFRTADVANLEYAGVVLNDTLSVPPVSVEVQLKGTIVVDQFDDIYQIATVIAIFVACLIFSYIVHAISHGYNFRGVNNAENPLSGAPDPTNPQAPGNYPMVERGVTIPGGVVANQGQAPGRA